MESTTQIQGLPAAHRHTPTARQLVKNCLYDIHVIQLTYTHTIDNAIVRREKKAIIQAEQMSKSFVAFSATTC